MRERAGSSVRRPCVRVGLGVKWPSALCDAVVVEWINQLTLTYSLDLESADNIDFSALRAPTRTNAHHSALNWTQGQVVLDMDLYTGAELPLEHYDPCSQIILQYIIKKLHHSEEKL